MASKKSVKSKSSVKSGKSGKTEYEEEKGFKDLKDIICKEADLGASSSVLDGPLPGNLEDQDVFETTLKDHEEEAKALADVKEKLRRRQVILDKRKLLEAERQEVEAMRWSHKLQLEEMEVADQQAYLDLKDRERRVKEQAKSCSQRAAEMKARELDEHLPVVEHDKDGRVAKWVDRTAAMETRSLPGGRADGVRMGTSNLATQSWKMEVLTASQQKINQLEAEVARLLTVDPRGAPAVGRLGPIKQLKDMGLMPMNISDVFNYPDQTVAPTAEERKKMGMVEPGKHDELSQQNQCLSCNDKQKLKSGKFAKTNINIKVQEQWPHLNVLRKYCKRSTFDQMDFELFVAGESRIILGTRDPDSAMARLRFLSMVAHWMCHCRDWSLVRSVYKAVLESTELGECTWFSDFSHYENMVPGVVKYDGKVLEKVDGKKKDKDKFEVYWCKAFQRNACVESSPHLTTLKFDEPPVLVIHCCAFCLQREGKRADHAEVDCPQKK